MVLGTKKRSDVLSSDMAAYFNRTGLILSNRLIYQPKRISSKKGRRLLRQFANQDAKQ